jgi:hypothetical protein
MSLLRARGNGKDPANREEGKFHCSIRKGEHKIVELPKPNQEKSFRHNSYIMYLWVLNLKFVMLHAIFSSKELSLTDDALQKQKANS